jgi:DNA repair protein RadA/Sms
MLLAVVEKRAGLMLGQADVFLNMAGGIRVDDPAIDLAVVAAIMSSLEDIAIPKTTCLAGEVGLSGEIRSINRIDLRIQEADRQGFRQLFLPRHNLKGLNPEKFGIELIGISKISELHELLFS